MRRGSGCWPILVFTSGKREAFETDLEKALTSHCDGLFKAHGLHLKMGEFRVMLGMLVWIVWLRPASSRPSMALCSMAGLGMKGRGLMRGSIACDAARMDVA